jgi:hypothetical protein
MSSSLSSFGALVLKDDSFPLLTDTIMTQVGILKNGNSISFDNLCLLPTVLASIDLPPNPTTLKIVDTILLENTVISPGVNTTLSNIALSFTTLSNQSNFYGDSLNINDLTTRESSNLNSSSLSITNISDNTTITSNNISVNDGTNASVTNSTSVSFTTLSNQSNFHGDSLNINDLTTGASSNLNSSSLSITNISDNTTITSNNISVNDGTNASVMNSLSVTCNDGITSFTQMDGTKFRTSDAFGVIGEMSANNTSLTYTNYVNGNISELSSNYLQLSALSSQVILDPYENHIKFTNNNSIVELKIGTNFGSTNMSTINSNMSDLFLNSDTKQLLKINTIGYSYKPILAMQNEMIERYMNYIVFDDGITHVDINTYTSLLDSDTTLPDEERVGWSCKFANLNSTDVTIGNMDGISYSSNYGSFSSPPYQLKKCAVVEVTLIWSRNLRQYFYAVSQYN